MIVAKNKSELLANLRSMLTEAFRLRNEGASYAKLSRSQGNADGYMRALIDMGVATEREILAVVVDQRRVVDGPATKEFDSHSILAA